MAERGKKGLFEGPGRWEGGGGGGWILQTGTACFCAFCLQQVVVRSLLNSIGRTVVQLAHLPRANSSLLRRGARPHTEPPLFFPLVSSLLISLTPAQFVSNSYCAMC